MSQLLGVQCPTLLCNYTAVYFKLWKSHVNTRYARPGTTHAWLYWIPTFERHTCIVCVLASFSSSWKLAGRSEWYFRGVARRASKSCIPWQLQPPQQPLPIFPSSLVSVCMAGQTCRVLHLSQTFGTKAGCTGRQAYMQHS